MASLTFSARIANQTGRGFRAIRNGMSGLEGANRRVTRSLSAINGAARRAQRSIATFSRVAIRQLNRVGRAAQRVGRGLRTAAGLGARGAAAGAAAAGAGLFAGIQFGQQARDLQRWAGILGITVTQVDALNRSARRFGSDGDVLFEALIATVDKAQAAILQGAEAESDFFREFGLNAREFIALDTEGQFNRMAESINRVQDPTLRAAVASALFGDEAVKLLPVLNQIAEEGLGGVTAAAESNATLLDGPAARALIQYDERWLRVRNRLESAARAFLVDVAPVFFRFTDWLLETGIPAMERWGGVFSEWLEDYTSPQVAITPFGDRFELPSQFERDIQRVSNLFDEVQVTIGNIDFGAELTNAIERIQLGIEDAQAIVDKIIGVWEDVERIWDNGPVIQIIRRIFSLLFSPIAQTIGAELDIALNGLGDTIAEKIRNVIDLGLGAALTAVAVVLRRRVGLFGGLFRVGLIGAMVSALNELDPSGITGSIAGIIVSALVLLPSRAANRISAAIGNVVRFIFRSLGRLFSLPVGSPTVGAIAQNIATTINLALNWLAGRVGAGTVFLALRYLARSILGALVSAFVHLGFNDLAVTLQAKIASAINAVTARLPSLSLSALVNAIRDRLVSLFGGLNVAGIRSALASALSAVFSRITWGRLIRGFGIAAVVGLILDGLVAAFTDENSLTGLIGRILPSWTETWSGLWAGIRDEFLIIGESHGNQLIDGLNAIIDAINEATDQLNPFGGGVGLQRIGRLTFADAARFRRGIRSETGLDPASSGYRFAAAQYGGPPTTGRDVTINIVLPQGPITQDAIDRTAEAVNEAALGGLIPGLEPR